MGLLSTIGAASGRAFGFTRSAIAAATDAFFNRVTLLLPGNGTNGAQNNTFLDSSSNNFTITRNGNTTQGTFSPFSQTGWGLRTSDRNYLTIPASADFDLINTDFTVEFWFNLNAFNTMSGSGNNFFGNGLSTANNGWSMGFAGSGTTVTSIEYRVFNSGAQSVNTFSGLSLSIGVWYHVVLQRNGSGSNNLRLFVNGVLQGAAQTAVTYSTAASTFAFGSGSYLQNIVYSGNADYYISNVRLTKSAVYSTSGFTSPTSNLSQLAGTTLLICQSNRLINNGTNTGAITPTTVNVTPIEVVAFSPFAPTAAYSAATVGGSGFFDGTGDNLAVPTATANAVESGSFYFEAWVYLTNPSVAQMIIADPANTGGLFVGLNIDGGGRFAIGRTAVAVDNFVNLTWVGNQWYHLAVNRNGTSLQFFVNGTQVGSTGTNSVNYPSRGYRVGAEQAAGSAALTGYISGLRLVKSSVNTTNFTPPTAPPTAITNTALLLNFTNAGITDATAKNDLETVGNAQISTTQSRFGGGSMLFNGTTDKLVTTPSPLFNFASSDFTIEGWFYTGSSATMLPLYSTLNRAKADVLSIQISGGIVYAYVSAAGGGAWSLLNGLVMGTVTYNAWNHIALVRSGSTWSGYVNGTRGSGFPQTNSAAVAAMDGFAIGDAAGAGFWYSGYMDDLRITRFARYSGATITAPTAAFPTQ